MQVHQEGSKIFHTKFRTFATSLDIKVREVCEIRGSPHLADLQQALGTDTVDRAKDGTQSKFGLGSIKILDRV